MSKSTSQGLDVGKMALDSFGQVMGTMDSVKRAWSTFNLPTPFTPTLSVEELDKRITDLRAVEQWLSLNQNMLRNTIQGLEIQRGTLNAVRTMSDSFGKAIKPADDAMAQALAQFAAAAAAAPASSRAAAAPAAPTQAEPMQAGVDPLAWWNLLQSNFQQIAQAAAGSQDEAPPASGRDAKAGAAFSPAKSAKSAKPARSAKPAQSSKPSRSSKSAQGTGPAGARPAARPKLGKPEEA